MNQTLEDQTSENISYSLDKSFEESSNDNIPVSSSFSNTPPPLFSSSQFFKTGESTMYWSPGSKTNKAFNLKKNQESNEQPLPYFHIDSFPLNKKLWYYKKNQQITLNHADCYRRIPILNSMESITKLDLDYLQKLYEVLKRENEILYKIKEEEKSKDFSNEKFNNLLYELSCISQDFFDLKYIVHLQIAGVNFPYISKRVTEDTSSFIPSTHIMYFSVMKINRFNKNTLRILKVDTQQKTLGVCKKESQEYDVYLQLFLINAPSIIDLVIPPNNHYVVHLHFITDKPKELSLSNLTKNKVEKKIFKMIFTHIEERERFLQVMNFFIIQQPPISNFNIWKPQEVQIIDDNLRSSCRLNIGQLPISKIAEEIHLIFWHHKFEDDWHYGFLFDSPNKRNPSLLPFNQLPFKEIQHIKALVNGIIESIYAIGFTIEKTIKDNILSTSTDLKNIENDCLILIEYFANNMHNIWCKNMMESGWSFGEDQDAQRMKHPLLMPWHCLEPQHQERMKQGCISFFHSLVQKDYKIISLYPPHEDISACNRGTSKIIGNGQDDDD